MEILARFSHDQVDHTQDSNIHLVVTLKAPTLDWMTKRPQLCVLPVIDLSGSMQGPKLNYAKQSLEKLVDQLQDGDYAGLIGFETRVHVLAKPQKVTAEFKDQLKITIRKLQVLGSTNFADAMVQAAREVERLDLPATFLKRIIMFTDGQPTAGITDTKQILKMVGGLAVENPLEPTEIVVHVATRENFDRGMLDIHLEHLKLADGVRVHEHTKAQLEIYGRQHGVPVVKPFMLVIASDTAHADRIVSHIASDDFYRGYYKKLSATAALLEDKVKLLKNVKALEQKKMDKRKEPIYTLRWTLQAP